MLVKGRGLLVRTCLSCRSIDVYVNYLLIIRRWYLNLVIVTKLPIDFFPQEMHTHAHTCMHIHKRARTYMCNNNVHAHICVTIRRWQRSDRFYSLQSVSSNMLSRTCGIYFPMLDYIFHFHMRLIGIHLISMIHHYIFIYFRSNLKETWRLN